MGYLSDAFWEARLDGFMRGLETLCEDEDIQVIPVGGARTWTASGWRW